MGWSRLVLSMGNAIGDDASLFEAKTGSGDSPLTAGLTGLVGKARVADSVRNARSETLVVDGCDKPSDTGGMIAVEKD